MFGNGYRRIWDCGNMVFTKKYDETSQKHGNKI
jgi:hypothetical protein